MKIEVYLDADSVAREAAALIATRARAAVENHGSFVIAISGGHTPWLMLRDLAQEKVPWDAVHVVQVDERVAPAGHPDRNLTHLRESLLEHSPLRPEHIYPMPVESSDLEAAAVQYAQTLRSIAGSPSSGSRASGTRTRRPYRLTRAWGSGPRCPRYGCRAHRALPGKTPYDVDLSHHQSLPFRPLARHRKRKSRHAIPPARRGRFNPSQPGPSRSRRGAGRSRRRGPGGYRLKSRSRLSRTRIQN